VAETEEELESLDERDPILDGDASVTLEELEVFELPIEPEVDLERVNERLEELPDIEEIV
jgi:hypothetical protein